MEGWADPRIVQVVAGIALVMYLLPAALRLRPRTARLTRLLAVTALGLAILYALMISLRLLTA